MKRFLVYRFISMVLLVVFIVLVVFNSMDKLIPNNSNDFWFYMLCIEFGFLLVLKAIIFKSDSALWFGSNLFLNGLLLIVFSVASFDNSYYWPFVILFVAISSLFVGVIFRDWFQTKLGIVVLVLAIFPYLFAFKIINLIQFIVFEVFSVIFAVLIHKMIVKIVMGIKRRSNG